MKPQSLSKAINVATFFLFIAIMAMSAGGVCHV